MRYLIKYEFATNNEFPKMLIYFYHRNSPVNESKRCRKQCRKWYGIVAEEKHTDT